MYLAMSDNETTVCHLNKMISEKSSLLFICKIMLFKEFVNSSFIMFCKFSVVIGKWLCYDSVDSVVT